MCASRSPEDRSRFVRSTAADLDVAPALAERLLLLSEAARDDAAGDGPDERRRRLLLELLLDDELCRHAWWVAAVEGEGLWRRLLRVARPPHDVGPAVLLAVALARRGGAADAQALITDVLWPGESRHSALEIGVDLAEDAGLPRQAWQLVARLGDADRSARWELLHGVLGCSADGPRGRARLAGATHARWLRHRVHRWRRRPWSGCDPANLRVRPEFEAASPAQWARDYAAARATLLPVGERELLHRWSLAERRLVTVVESDGFELIVDDGGTLRRVGLERPSPSPAAPGCQVSGHLLPTLVPEEWLLVGSAAPRSGPDEP